MNNPDSDLEKRLWSSADKLRSNMDAAEYKHVVLGLIFLKYVSDSFEEIHRELENDREHFSDPEDRDEYASRNVFWVPPEARWNYLQRNAKQPTIGKMIDDAMEVIERDNPSLKGVLPTNYSRASLDKQRLGELIDLIGGIELGTESAKSMDQTSYPCTTQSSLQEAELWISVCRIVHPSFPLHLQTVQGNIHRPCQGDPCSLHSLCPVLFLLSDQ